MSFTAEELAEIARADAEIELSIIKKIAEYKNDYKIREKFAQLYQRDTTEEG